MPSPVSHNVSNLSRDEDVSHKPLYNKKISSQDKLHQQLLLETVNAPARDAHSIIRARKISEQLQDTGPPADAAGVDMEASALDIASWEIESWEIESASDSDESICSVKLDEDMLSGSFPVEETEDLEGSDDGIDGLTGSTTMYPGPNGLDLDEEYFTYPGSTLAPLKTPEDEQEGEDPIVAVTKRIRKVLQSQSPVHPNFWAPKRPSQTRDEVFASLSRPDILTLNLDKEHRHYPICWKDHVLKSSSPVNANESPRGTNSSAVDIIIPPKETAGSDNVTAVRSGCVHR